MKGQRLQLTMSLPNVVELSLPLEKAGTSSATEIYWKCPLSSTSQLSTSALTTGLTTTDGSANSHYIHFSHVSSLVFGSSVILSEEAHISRAVCGARSFMMHLQGNTSHKLQFSCKSNGIITQCAHTTFRKKPDSATFDEKFCTQDINVRLPSHDCNSSQNQEVLVSSNNWASQNQCHQP